MILDVIIEARLAGRLRLDTPDGPVFTYGDSYASDPGATPLSTLFPLSGGGSGEPLQRWLEGMLPDDDAVLRSLSERYDADLAHRVRLLGTEMGEDCAGAVQFCVPTRTDALLEGRGGCDPISDDEVLDWLTRLRDDPAYRPTAHETTAGFCLAGMQPKIALRRTDTGWAVPWGAEASSHILKVTRPGPYPHEALMEHITLRTAARMGIAAARTEVISNDDVQAIVVQRYDRAPTPDGRLVRVHQEDLCQALGCSPDTKYQFQGGPTPASIAALLRSVDVPGSAQMVETFRDMLAFQWLIVGTDGHSKNYGLLLRGAARRAAPLYDACTWIPYRQRSKISQLRLALKIGRDYRISSADQPSAVLRTAGNLALDPEATAERFQQLAASMPDASSAVAETLPPALHKLPIVANYLIEQRQRAARCEQVASKAVSQLRSQRTATPTNPATAVAGDADDAGGYLQQIAPAAAVSTGDITERAASDAAQASADTPHHSTIKAAIIALLTANKTITYQNAAQRLGTTVGYVRAVASEAGLTR